MEAPRKPRETPTPRERPVSRRPFYYPAGWGCLFWLLVILIIWLIGGLLFWPLWPWWT